MGKHKYLTNLLTALFIWPITAVQFTQNNINSVYFTRRDSVGDRPKNPFNIQFRSGNCILKQ